MEFEVGQTRDSPQSDSGGLPALAAGYTRLLAAENSDINLVFSPLSIYVKLASGRQCRLSLGGGCIQVLVLASASACRTSSLRMAWSGETQRRPSQQLREEEPGLGSLARAKATFKFSNMSSILFAQDK
jgi:hypothetical protein